VIERLLQTYRHIVAEPDEAVARTLTPDQRTAIARLGRADRRHALATYAKLRRAGADEELCAVGLLHDVGKPMDTQLWHRVAAVLAPGLARRLGRETMRAYLDHARRGAERARALGMSERAVRLIERHHQPAEDDDSRLLAAADRDHA
jgi:putative nucleotidyltransferase with HDIG domain